MWQLIKSLQKKDVSGNDIEITEDGDVVTDDIVANNFNEHFINLSCT